jgi:CubicO group peptidase (beta-lactamase class C family)
MNTIVAAAVAVLLAGCASTPVPDLDTRITQLMQKEQVQGMALAVIDGGAVRHVRAFGKRDVARNLPLQPDTVMYGASLTKAAFAYMVLQLVDEGRLDLDASIATILPRPLPSYHAKDHDYRDLAGDDRWRLVTPRMLLNHASGFANFRFLEPDGKLRFHFTPGTRYAYSGEGIQLLQVVLEQGLGLDVGKEMQTRVFDRFGMTQTSMMWRPDFASNLAHGYKIDGSFEEHDERSRVRAAGSMDTSIADQARMWAGIVSGDGLSQRARAELSRPQLAISTAQQFPSLTASASNEHAGVGLAAGLGVITYREPQGQAWFKGGHNDSTGNMVICQDWRLRCVVMLANDVRAERIYPDIARLVLGETRMPWRWEYGPTAPASGP